MQPNIGSPTGSSGLVEGTGLPRRGGQPDNRFDLAPNRDCEAANTPGSGRSSRARRGQIIDLEVRDCATVVREERLGGQAAASQTLPGVTLEGDRFELLPG